VQAIRSRSAVMIRPSCGSVLEMVSLATAEREAKRVAWEEAALVSSAFGAQVAKRRQRWINAGDAQACERARRDLAEAVAQHDAARAKERAAWRAWHGAA